MTNRGTQFTTQQVFLRVLLPLLLVLFLTGCHGLLQSHLKPKKVIDTYEMQEDRDYSNRVLYPYYDDTPYGRSDLDYK